MRYQLYGERVLHTIAELEDHHLRDEILADLYQLEYDPENREGANPAIAKYREPSRPFTYSIVVASGRAIVVYRVKQDYPKVQLVRLLLVD